MGACPGLVRVTTSRKLSPAYEPGAVDVRIELELAHQHPPWRTAPKIAPTSRFFDQNTYTRSAWKSLYLEAQRTLYPVITLKVCIA